MIFLEDSLGFFGILWDSSGFSGDFFGIVLRFLVILWKFLKILWDSLGFLGIHWDSFTHSTLKVSQWRRH